MALVFELVVNFGQDVQAAESACCLVATYPPLSVGEQIIDIHGPMLREVASDNGERYLEVSVLPVGVGYGVAVDRGYPRLRLTLPELTELGNGLYRLLSSFTGYRVARVGWDPEPTTDLCELQEEWQEEMARGDLPGLVLSTEVHRSFAASRGFRPFAPGFVWIPYRGETRT